MEGDGEMTITEFLLARISEDEELVSGHSFSITTWDTGVTKCPHPKHYEHTPYCHLAHWSARVLAECAAKRKIVEGFELESDGGFPDGQQHDRVLPDHRQEWA